MCLKRICKYLKYISKVMRHFVKILRHFFIFHRIDLTLSGSFLRTMWDIFRVISFENNEIITGKMKKKVLRLYQKSTFCAEKKHASGNFNLSLVEFSLFPTPDPFPLPFIAPQRGPNSHFSAYILYSNILKVETRMCQTK